MVEFNRFAQTAGLRQKGWVEDEECRRLAVADDSIGGPTYMRAPDGLMYAVSCGNERLLEGIYKRWHVRLPKDFQEQKLLEESSPFTVRTVIYGSGRVSGAQG